MTAKQTEALKLIKTAGVPVPVRVPNRHTSRFCVHPLVAQKLISMGLSEWDRSDNANVDATPHLIYAGN